VSGELWDGRGAVLADTSAWIVAGRSARARELLLAAVERGDIAWCWPVRYELMIDARDSEAIAAVDQTLEGLRQIAVDGSVQPGVLSDARTHEQRLARRSSAATRRSHGRGRGAEVGARHPAR
jgi:predicted nucleic acid-binding protein